MNVGSQTANLSDVGLLASTAASRSAVLITRLPSLDRDSQSAATREKPGSGHEPSSATGSSPDA